MLRSTLSVNIQYWVTFTLKTPNGRQNVKKNPVFYTVCLTQVQFMYLVTARFVLDKFISRVFERKLLLFDFQIQMFQRL